MQMEKQFNLLELTAKAYKYMYEELAKFNAVDPNRFSLDSFREVFRDVPYCVVDVIFREIRKVHTALFKDMEYAPTERKIAWRIEQTRISGNKYSNNFEDTLESIFSQLTFMGQFQKAYIKGAVNLFDFELGAYNGFMNPDQFVTCVPVYNTDKYITMKSSIRLMDATGSTVRGYLDRFDANDEYFTVYIDTKYSVMEKKHGLPIYGRRGTVSMYVPFFKQDDYFLHSDGRYYDYDEYDKEIMVLSKGRIPMSEANAPVEVGNTGVYIDADFQILSYDTNILNIFPQFKSMPYESVRSGSRIATQNTLYLGVELETEVKDGGGTEDLAYQIITDLKGDAITVHDGSLDCGIEIVSSPSTLNYHYQLWDKVCNAEWRRELGSTGYSSCGMHVHMSKECFTDLSLGKFLYFINSSNNTEFINVVAGRTANGYSQRRPTKLKYGKYRDRYTTDDGRGQDKYWATNLLNEKTVEVRMFKGSLSYASIMAHLEFCHALHRYVTYHAGNRELSYTSFTSWLKDKKQNNRKAYPYLYQLLLVHKYIDSHYKGRIQPRERDQEDVRTDLSRIVIPHVLKDAVLDSYRKSCTAERNQQRSII